MRGHGVCILERESVGRWVIRCECLAPVRGADPLAAHRRHQDHIVAEHLAELSGVEHVGA